MTTIKKLPLFIFIVSALLMLGSSCTKETTVMPTAADQAVSQIEKVIAEQGVKKIYWFDYPGGGWSTLPASVGSLWSFSNGFLIVEGYGASRYMGDLYTYNVGNVGLDNGSTAKALLLYFK